MMSADLNYRNVLRNEFERRHRLQAGYSLRRYARDLGVSPAQLSQVLNGKRGLSERAAGRMAEAMGYTKREVDLFRDLVTSAEHRNEARRQAAMTRVQAQAAQSAYKPLELDAFQMISDWYHMAILQLISIKGFRPDPVWIAARLGIGVIEASSALQRLTRLGFISIRGGTQVQVKEPSLATPDVPSEAIRTFHRQIMEKALAALETQPTHERDFGSILMSVRREDIPEAKKWLQEFRRKFCADLEKETDKDAVFCLSTQFFSLTKKTATSPLAEARQISNENNKEMS